VAGCDQQQKVAPVPLGEMEDYRDPGIGFHIKVPRGWITDAQVGRARFYNAPEVDKKFLDPTGAYPLGVVITVDVTKTDNAEGAKEELVAELTAAGIQVGQQEVIRIGDTEGTKVPYTANYGGGNIVTGYHVLITTESELYDVGFAGFGAHYEAYATIFNASMNSFTLPAPKIPGRDETLPSETLASYDASMFTFMYPENFNFNNVPKGRFEKVVELSGVRLDCTIRFDVFDAQGLTVDRVFEQNKATYRGRSSQQTTIGGEPALFVNYPSRSDVDSRAYFVVKNDKVLRISMNWFKPQASEYIPVYEKLISSIKFK
jgi:hypothetical protein